MPSTIPGTAIGSIACSRITGRSTSAPRVFSTQ